MCTHTACKVSQLCCSCAAPQMHVRCSQALHVVRRGYQYKAGFLDGIKREVITIYEILRDSANNLLWAVPDYQFTCASFGLTISTVPACISSCNACRSRYLGQSCMPESSIFQLFQAWSQMCLFTARLTARLLCAGTMPPRRAMSAP